MKQRIINLPGALLFLILISPLFSQAVNREMSFEIDGETHQIAEFGALLAEVDDGLKILMTMPPEHRPKAYKDIDVEAEDELLMMNGKRIRTVAEFKEQYERLGIGEEVKLGLRRGERMFISRFPKIDPENAPRVVMKVQRDGDGGGMNEDLTVAAELGMLLRDGENGLEIETIRGLGEVEGLDIKDGDILKSLDGQQISSTAQWDDLFTKNCGR